MITVILMSLITHAEWKTLTELPSGHLPILLTIKYATKIENTTERLQIIKKNLTIITCIVEENLAYKEPTEIHH